MNNEVLVYGFCVACAVACVIAFALYHVYHGIHGNLTNARIGDVFNFEYLQPHKGDPERFLVKVVDIITLSDNHVKRLNATSNYRKHDSNFHRTNHLITGQSPDGSIRNFYAERVVNCRRSPIGRALFKVGVAHLF